MRTRSVVCLFAKWCLRFERLKNELNEYSMSDYERWWKMCFYSSMICNNFFFKYSWSLICKQRHKSWTLFESYVLTHKHWSMTSGHCVVHTYVYNIHCIHSIHPVQYIPMLPPSWMATFWSKFQNIVILLYHTIIPHNTHYIRCIAIYSITE